MLISSSDVGQAPSYSCNKREWSHKSKRRNIFGNLDILEPVLRLINFSPYRLFNYDEKRLTAVQHKVYKVVPLKGKRRISLSLAVCGSLLTIDNCVNSTVTYVSPLLVFSMSTLKAELLDSVPPGSIAAYHMVGRIQKESTMQWFKHFVGFVKLSNKYSFILTLDAHFSHSRNIKVRDCARENWVHIVCLPTHCNHEMQILDVFFMQPLKTYFAQEMEIWMKNHPNIVVTHYKITGLIGKAYFQSATAAIAVYGFQKTGLFPDNLHKLDELDPRRISAHHHQLFA
jgi:hypothetical protein